MREADVSVDDEAFDAMGIADLVAEVRAGGLRNLEELACRGTAATVRVDVEERLEGDRLDDLTVVNDWEHVADGEDGHSYVVAFTSPDLPAALADTAADLIGTCDPDVGEDAATLSLVGPQDAIAATVADYEEAGVAPTLERLRGYEGEGNGDDGPLTDRQEEVVRTAFDLGYYEVPRAASTADVASELDLDSSTVAEHLQRAERNVLAHHL